MRATSRTIRRLGLVLLATCLAAGTPTVALGAGGTPGSLDHSFHGTGRLVLPKADEINAIAHQGTKILLAGRALVHNGDMAVVRLNADGSLDRSFGGGDGWFTFDLARGEDDARALVVLPGGAILVSGYGYDIGIPGTEGILLRLSPDGRLDHSFGGGDGIVITEVATTSIYFNALAVRGDGRSVACGTLVNHLGVPEMVAVRYLPNGHLDTSFFGGIVEMVFPGQTSQRCGAVVLVGHKTVAVGTASIGSTQSFAVARLGPRGHYDQGFDGDGQVLFTPTTNNVATGALALAGGKLLVAGSVVGSDSDVGLLRLRQDGSPDPTFGGGDGYVADDLGGSDDVEAIARQPNGDLLVAGYRDTAMAVVRYGPRGRRDMSFGHHGVQATPWPLETYGSAIALWGGKAVAGGQGYTGLSYPGVVERLFT